MSWYVFALLSVFVLAGAEISQKISLSHKANISAITNNFYVWLMQGVGGLILALTFGQTTIQLEQQFIINLALVAIVYFAGGTFFYSSYKGNSPSISIILGSVSVIVSTLLGIVLFYEATTILKFVAILGILSSIVIVNLNNKERFSKYNLLALAGGACFGVAFTIDKANVTSNISPLLYVSILSFSVGILSLILSPRRIIAESARLRIVNFKSMALAAFFGVLFNAFTFLAYSKGGNVGVVDAMNNSSLLIIILLEIVVLHNRLDLKKKLIGATIVIASLAALSTL